MTWQEESRAASWVSQLGARLSKITGSVDSNKIADLTGKSTSGRIIGCSVVKLFTGVARKNIFVTLGRENLGVKV